MELTKFIILIFTILLFFLGCKDREHTDNSSKSVSNQESQTLCENLNLKEVVKISKYFPIGVVKSDATSICQTICNPSAKIIKEGSRVGVFNYSPYISNENEYQVMFNNELYCLSAENIILKEELSIFEGISNEFDPVVWARYVRLKNNKYISIINYTLTTYEYGGEEIPFEFGSIEEGKDKIKFCEDKKLFEESNPNQEGENIKGCYALKRIDVMDWQYSPEKNAKAVWFEKLKQAGNPIFKSEGSMRYVLLQLK